METRVLFMQLAYLLSAVLFILGLKRLSHPDTARGGNRLAATGVGAGDLLTASLAGS